MGKSSEGLQLLIREGFGLDFFFFFGAIVSWAEHIKLCIMIEFVCGIG